MKLFVLLLVSLLLISKSGFSTNYLSISNGDWNAPSTWSNGSCPAAGDQITINSGHTVSVSSIINLVGPGTTIIIDGVLLFDSIISQLKVPCGSVIFINSSGSIQTSIIGPVSQAIQICREVIWVGADGTLAGSLVFGIILPIELTFFNAEANGSMIDFTWQTASENNNDFFTIEGSVEGLYWNEMNQVDGAGITQEEQNYSYRSANNNNYVYFRLKQTDFDGKYDYSDMVAVELIRDRMKVYPNPNRGSVLNIELPSKQSGILQILNANGRVVYSEELICSQELQLTGLNLKVGIYFVQIQQNNQLLMERLVIQ